ncbi:MAG: AAA family ATPase [Deltaproteobacteria bacterium]|nr:AAA family ATPase [Deltaproteobacteria bacterium]
MINTLINLSKKKKTIFPKFIYNINFPFYKNLEKGTRITFDFPLTLLVGPNGCGKSSALQAIYGCPKDSSTGDFWFSTVLDPIRESGLSNGFWYEYYNQEAKKIVQVRKLRSRYKKGQRENPDYWEPSRPSVKYGMKAFKEGEEGPGSIKTRWKLLEIENVVYLDFRSILSAFDKYFYFASTPKAKTFVTKQDFLREKSKYLKEVYNGNLNNYFLNQHERISKHYQFNDDELKIISEILGKEYVSAKFLIHDFYNQKPKEFGTSVLFKTKNMEYSEAFAGSGENSVATLVYHISRAAESSLILLDEPEVSIHPGAQKKIIKYLQKEIIKKKHQVVICTHSPSMIEGLPNNAIKVFYQSSTGKQKVLPECPAELAFKYIGHTVKDKYEIIVEDQAAQELIITVMNKIDEGLKELYEVNFYPGGADDMFKEMVVFSRVNEEKKYFWFDGDKNEASEIKPDNLIADGDLDTLIYKKTDICVDKFQFAADSGKQNEHLIIEKRKYLQFFKNHTLFLPDEPEDILLKASVLTNLDPNLKDCLGTNENSKTIIKKWADKELPDSNAADLHTYRKRLLNQIDFNHEDIISITNTINEIINKNRFN